MAHTDGFQLKEYLRDWLQHAISTTWMPNQQVERHSRVKSWSHFANIFSFSWFNITMKRFFLVACMDGSASGCVTGNVSDSSPASFDEERECGGVGMAAGANLFKAFLGILIPSGSLKIKLQWAVCKRVTKKEWLT